MANPKKACWNFFEITIFEQYVPAGRKNIAGFFKKFTFLFDLYTNSSCEWLQVWVHHKIEKKGSKTKKTQKEEPGQDTIYCNFKWLAGLSYQGWGKAAPMLVKNTPQQN